MIRLLGINKYKIPKTVECYSINFMRVRGGETLQGSQLTSFHPFILNSLSFVTRQPTLFFRFRRRKRADAGPHGSPQRGLDSISGGAG